MKLEPSPWFSPSTNTFALPIARSLPNPLLLKLSQSGSSVFFVQNASHVLQFLDKDKRNRKKVKNKKREKNNSIDLL